MSEYGFVYIWFDKKNKKFYIGSHWGTEDDGYICSSNWMKRAYNNRPSDFKRRIISKIYTNRLDTFLEEEKYLDMIKSEELKVRYYNISNSIKAHWSGSEEGIQNIKEKRKKYIPTEETRRKLSLARKGQWLGENNPNYNPEIRAKITLATTGKKRTIEQKEKMKEAISHINHKGKNNPMFGVSLVPWNKGKTLSEEHKRKMSEAQKGKSPWNKGLNKKSG